MQGGDQRVPHRAQARVKGEASLPVPALRRAPGARAVRTRAHTAMYLVGAQLLQRASSSPRPRGLLQTNQQERKRDELFVPLDPEARRVTQMKRTMEAAGKRVNIMTEESVKEDIALEKELRGEDADL